MHRIFLIPWHSTQDGHFVCFHTILAILEKCDYSKIMSHVRITMAYICANGIKHPLHLPATGAWICMAQI
jgi:hypothetical protein